MYAETARPAAAASAAAWPAPVDTSRRATPMKAWVRSVSAAIASPAPWSYARAKAALVASFPAMPAWWLSRAAREVVRTAAVWFAVRQASAARVNPPHSTVIRTPPVQYVQCSAASALAGSVERGLAGVFEQEYDGVSTSVRHGSPV